MLFWCEAVSGDGGGGGEESVLEGQLKECIGTHSGETVPGGGGFGISNSFLTASCRSTSDCTIDTALFVVQYTNTDCGMVMVRGPMASANPRNIHNMDCCCGDALGPPSAALISIINRKDTALSTGKMQ